MSVSRQSKLLLGLTLVVTAALYWPGLSGPFLFDDFWNLTAVEKWYDGTRSWRQALMPNPDSFVFSRPVSMASFMLTIWLGGLGTFPVKLGNLVLHLICGLLVWHLIRRALKLDPRLSPHADLLGTAGTAIWLLHPLQVSTVLYAVQRMTQLSTLFTLAAVLIYLFARTQLVAHRIRAATLNLFMVFPLLLVLGILSKQNAVVAPFLCLTLELAYFTAATEHRRRVLTFFTVFGLLPLLAVVIAISAEPAIVLEGYRDWGYTLEQRLLTQPRALMDYVGMLLVPYAPSMGLYTDDFAVSTGLLKPVTTLLAMLGLAACSLFAIAVRKRAPSVFAGWFFFLVAHGVESSFLPLEMYYEHRNYLPSVGLFLAVIGLGAFIPTQLRTNVLSLRQLLVIAASVFVFALSVATLGRVLVWQSRESIIVQGVSQHPNSLHAVFDKTSLEIDRKRYGQAARDLEPLLNSSDPRNRVVGKLFLAAIDCMRGKTLDSRLLDSAVADARPQLTVYEAQMIKLLDQASQLGECRGRSEGALADSFGALLRAATLQPEASPNKFVIREIIARLYARAGRWPEAERQAEIAWQNGRHPPVGAMLTRFYVKNGKYAEARRLLATLEQVIDPDDKGGQQELQVLRKLTRGPSTTAGG
jgi:protein O-mannosyl-transferase